MPWGTDGDRVRAVSRTFATATLMVTIAGVVGSLAAQQSILVRQGQRVRLALWGAPLLVENLVTGRADTLQGENRIHGTVTLVSFDTLVVTGPEHRYRVPRAAVRRLEVSRGRHSRAARGFVYGALGGAVVSLAALGMLCGDDGCIGSGTVLFPAFAVGGGLAGGVVGAGVGLLVQGERWEYAHFPDQRPASPRSFFPARLAVGIRLRLREF